MPDVSVLTVKLYGEPIGTLTRFGDEPSIFAFNDAYAGTADRATLALSFKDRYGELRNDFKPIKTPLTPFFSNLLPEGPLRGYLTDKAGVNETRAFFLIQALGRDVPGAVRVVAADAGAWPVSDDPGRQAMTDSDNAHNNALRFSLAGVQLKFSAVIGAASSLTIPASVIGDMHLKNWSLIHPDQKNAKLSPADDVVSTIPDRPNDQSALNFSRARRFDEFTEDEILHLANKAALPRKLVIGAMRETVSLFMERWRAGTAHFPMPTDVVGTIDRHQTTLPIIGEALA